jgi:hypothetical protein
MAQKNRLVHKLVREDSCVDRNRRSCSSACGWSAVSDVFQALVFFIRTKAVYLPGAKVMRSEKPATWWLIVISYAICIALMAGFEPIPTFVFATTRDDSSAPIDRVHQARFRLREFTC